MKWDLMLIPVQRRLFLSLLTGLFFAAGSWLYLNRAQKKIAQHYQMTTVLCARRYIARGKPVLMDQVEEIKIPVAYVQPTALRAKEDLLGKNGALTAKARIGLLKGEQITRSKLYEDDALLGLAWTLPPGQTALSIKLAPEQAVFGHLQPGDWVHVFCTLDQQPGWSLLKTELLLPKVQTLAVQEHVWNPSASSIDRISSKPAGEIVWVTLSVTPREAALLSLASSRGLITLSLASPLDDKEAVPFSVGMRDLKVGG